MSQVITVNFWMWLSKITKWPASCAPDKRKRMAQMLTESHRLVSRLALLPACVALTTTAEAQSVYRFTFKKVPSRKSNSLPKRDSASLAPTPASTPDSLIPDKRGLSIKKVDATCGLAAQVMRISLPTLDSMAFMVKAGLLTARHLDPEDVEEPWHISSNHEGTRQSKEWYQERQRLRNSRAGVPYWGAGLELNFTPRISFVSDVKLHTNPKFRQMSTALAYRF